MMDFRNQRLLKSRSAQIIGLALAAPSLAFAQQQNQGQDQAESNQQQTQSQRDSDSQQTQVARSESQSGSDEANPYARADGSWITLSGTVDEVRANAFRLNYGDGTVTVEMDDADRKAEGYDLATGDEVTVFGRVDDDLFEEAAIEASSVYVPKTSTYFFASSLDEEDIYAIMIPAVSYDPSSASVLGKVAEVDDGEFTIDAGTSTVRIDVEEMPYDPMDQEGYQQIEVGDVVSVTGEVDDDFFEGRELQANSVITLFEEIG